MDTLKMRGVYKGSYDNILKIMKYNFPLKKRKDDLVENVLMIVKLNNFAFIKFGKIIQISKVLKNNIIDFKTGTLRIEL